MMRGWIFHWFERIHSFDISKPRVEFQIKAIASPMLLTSMTLLQISALVTGRNDARIPFSGIALGALAGTTCFRRAGHLDAAS
jgi:hypothetical protein